MGCGNSKKTREYVSEHWMTDLTERVRKFPLINIAIPGSHNSMTYGINSSSKPALDAEDNIKKLYTFFPCVIRRWSITQSVNIIEQLKLGVRYIDIRISLKDDTKFFFAHGLYAMEIFEPLNQIRSFLDNHPKEVIILDFQHFYGFKDSHHKQLQYDLKTIFEGKLYTRRDGSLTNATLTHFENLGKQIILIYRRYQNIPFEFWTDNNWPTPWPNTCSIKQLKHYLDEALKGRDPRCGYVSQCILTPNTKYITLRVWSSLKNTAKKVDKKLSDWIEEQRAGEFDMNESPKSNVFIADFVHLQDGDFCKKIISLNKYSTELDKVI